jgi:branched-chain amino acid transport system substrate-binding protein
MVNPVLPRRTLIAGAAALPALFAPRIGRAADDIVVGATVPITGPLAGSGLQYYDSLQMAQDDINKAGGINGRNLKIVFEDTQASNSVAVNAFIKLTQQLDPVFVFLSSYTIQNLAVEQAVAKAEVPVVYAGGGPAIADKKNPWMFRIRPADNLASEAIAAALAGPMKAKNVGILHVQDDYGNGSANALEAELAKSGVKVVARESYSPRDNDFSAELLSLKNKGAEAMVAYSYTRDGALVLTQRRSLGLAIPMIGNTSFVVPSLLDLVTPADVAGIYSVMDAVLGAPRGPASVAYTEKFLDRFKMKADPFGSCYYDAAMMLADGLRKVGLDKKKLRDYFAAIKDYEGVTRSFTTDDRQDMAHNVALVDFAPGTKDLKLVSYYPSKPA